MHDMYEPTRFPHLSAPGERIVWVVKLPLPLPLKADKVSPGHADKNSVGCPVNAIL